MKSPQSQASASSNARIATIQRELSKLIDHFKAETRRVDDRRLRGLMDKSSEVLNGLRTLFERYAAANQDRQKTEPAPTVGKNGGRKPALPVKPKGGKKSAPLAKAGSAGARAGGKNSGQLNGKSGATSEAKVAKADVRPAADGASSEADSSPAPQQPTVSTPTVAAAKPHDPDAIAAMEQVQRKEARAPKGPGGYSAPRPMPPRSGKPVWSKPHSS